MPMELRRRWLASQYLLKICSNLSNPVRNCAFDKRFTKLFDKRPNQIRPLGLLVKTDLSAIGFKQKDIFTSSISTVPPWLLKTPSVDLSLSNFTKAETIPEVFKCKFLEICDGLQGFCQIYTDGSKTNNGTAAAAVNGDVVKSLRITSHASIFTAELVALNLALDIIGRLRRKKICHLLWFVIRSGGYSQLPVRNVTLLLLFGYQVILVSEVMNVQMRLQKQLSAQQSHLWSAQPLISPQSLLSTIVKSGRLNPPGTQTFIQRYFTVYRKRLKEADV